MLPEADLYRQIVESLPLGVYVVGLDRRIAFWNKAAEEITGHLSQEVIGRPCHADVLVHCGAQGTPVCASAGCLLTCALRDRRQTETALFARHKDGHRIPVCVRSIPLIDGEGKIVALAELFQKQGSGAELRWTSDPMARPDGVNAPSIFASETYLETKLKSPEGLAVFMIEVPDQQAMANQRGWEMVYTMTRTMVHTIMDMLPMPHFLGRWHGDRFLIVVPGSTEQSFQDLREQLQGVGNSCSISWWGDRVSAQLRVSGTLLHAGDTVESLLSRVGAGEEVGPQG